jgi:hypothetical protein
MVESAATDPIRPKNPMPVACSVTIDSRFT